MREDTVMVLAVIVEPNKEEKTVDPVINEDTVMVLATTVEPTK